MPFWKNERYTDVETACKEGDPMRGLPRRDFPWEILSEHKKDTAGDSWHVRVQCLSVEPDKVGNRMVVTLEAYAQCQISTERLETLGFDPGRLTWMGVTTDGALERCLRTTFRVTLKDIEKVAKLLRDRFVSQLFATTNDESKRAAVREKATRHSISGFDHRSGITHAARPPRS